MLCGQGSASEATSGTKGKEEKIQNQQGQMLSLTLQVVHFAVWDPLLSILANPWMERPGRCSPWCHKSQTHELNNFTLLSVVFVEYKLN